MPENDSRQVPKQSRLRIRIYRQGLGDCFLLTFYGDADQRHILIDCGVLTGSPGGKDLIRQVAASIQQETGGKLAALVATHEHWDHISGFYDAKDIFDAIAVDEIWVAWTEDPANPLAKEMKRQNRLKLQALQLALVQLSKSEERQLQAYGQGISDLLSFYGGASPGSTLAAFSEKTSEAMAAVTRRTPPPTYWKPGDLILRNWLPGVRIYVLGPPMDPAMIKRETGKPGTETYGLTGADRAFASALEEALLTADAPADPGRTERLAAAYPFERSLQWTNESLILKDPHLGPLYRAYLAEDAGWRRIDQDWLMSAARLGLQLDSGINNTSLVLAIEMVSSGKVLLFAADAQISSWKSWLTLNWSLREGNGSAKTIATPDLLRRTVFYKVGHHGSHNATLKEGGLESMNSPQLAAAIPVNEVFAKSSKHWEMPATALFARLRELTRGRILRADALWPTPDDAAPAGLSTKEWQQFLESVRLDQDGLFIDYYIE